MAENVLLLPRELSPYRPLIEQTASKYGIDPALWAGLLMYESGGNAGVVNKDSGATGLGQVMPAEAGFPGRPTQKELQDPAVNLEWSARILADGIRRYGTEGGLAAYLGAVDPNTGRPTTAQDANGTNGFTYVNQVTSRARQYGYSGSGGALVAGASAMAANQQAQLDPTEADLIGKLQAANAALEQHASKPQPQTSAAIEAWKTDRKRLEDLYDQADKRLEDYRKEQRTNATRPASTASQVVNTDSTDQYILQRNPDGSLRMKADGSGPEVIANPNYRAPSTPVTKTPEQLAAESAANISQSNAAAAASAASANRTNALLPVELIRAQAEARATMLEGQRNEFLAAVTRQFTSGEIDEATAQQKMAQYDSISAGLAERLAADTETRMREALNETIRANQAAEQSRSATLAEQSRSNASQEQLDRMRFDSEQSNRDATLDLSRRREEREAAEGVARTRTDQVRAATDALGQYSQTGIASAPFQAGIAAALAPLMSLPGAADAAKAMGWSVPSIAPTAPTPLATPTAPTPSPVIATKPATTPPTPSAGHVFLPTPTGPNPIPDLATQAAQSHTFLPL